MAKSDTVRPEADCSVSVVVPTRKRPSKLTRLLSSFDSLRNFPSEVIVVADSDDYETNQVLELWEQKPHEFQVHVLNQQGGMGPGTARNLGASAAKEEVVAFIDDDCVAHPEWISNIVNKIDKEKRIVGVGGRIVPLGTDLISRYYDYYRILEPPNSLEYLVTANCCYLKNPVLEVGGFQEDIRKPGGEDVSLSLKLARLGWRFGFSEEAIVYHDFRAGISDFVGTFRNYGAGVHRATTRYQSTTIRSTPATVTTGGYGYGSLAPSGISPVDLLQEVKSVYRAARNQIGIRDALAFSVLRVLQRLSYYYGWRLG